MSTMVRAKNALLPIRRLRAIGIASARLLLRGIPHDRLKLHEEWMRGYDWSDWGDESDPCDALLAKGDMCAKADKQITALELNLDSGRESQNCNCLMQKRNCRGCYEILYAEVPG